MENGYTDGFYYIRGKLGESCKHVWHGPYGDIDNARFEAKAIWEQYDMDFSAVPRDIVYPEIINAFVLLEIGKRVWQSWDTYLRPVGRWVLIVEDEINEQTIGAFSEPLDVLTGDELAALIRDDDSPDNAACFGPFDEDFCIPCDDFQEAIDALPPFDGQQAIQNIRFTNGYPNDIYNYIAPPEWVGTNGLLPVAWDSLLPAYAGNNGVPGRYIDNIKIGVFLEAELQTEISWGNGEPGGLGYYPIVFPTDRFNANHYALRLTWQDTPYTQPDTGGSAGIPYTDPRDFRNRGLAYPMTEPFDGLILENKVPIANGGKSFPVLPGSTSANVYALAGSHVPFLSVFAGIKPWKVRAYVTMTWDVVDAGGPVECEHRTHWFSEQYKISAETLQAYQDGPFPTYPWDVGFFGGGSVAPPEPEPEPEIAPQTRERSGCYEIRVPHPFGIWLTYKLCPDEKTFGVETDINGAKPGIVYEYGTGYTNIDLGFEGGQFRI